MSSRSKTSMIDPDIQSFRRPTKLVTIYCDGSSLGNGRDAARAAAVALLGYKGLWRAFWSDLGKTTNQQAQIAAAAVWVEGLAKPLPVRGDTGSPNRIL